MQKWLFPLTVNHNSSVICVKKITISCFPPHKLILNNKSKSKSKISNCKCLSGCWFVESKPCHDVMTLALCTHMLKCCDQMLTTCCLQTNTHAHTHTHTPLHTHTPPVFLSPPSFVPQHSLSPKCERNLHSRPTHDHLTGALQEVVTHLLPPPPLHSSTVCHGCFKTIWPGCANGWLFWERDGKTVCYSRRPSEKKKRKKKKRDC